MFILDFSSDKRSAFLHGLLKGMAAPVSLSHSEPLPQVRVKYVRPVLAESVTEAIRSDWRKIGCDLASVIDHEPTAEKRRFPEEAGRTG